MFGPFSLNSGSCNILLSSFLLRVWNNFKANNINTTGIFHTRGEGQLTKLEHRSKDIWMIYQFQGFLSSRHFKQFIQEFHVKAILKSICQKFSTIEQNDNYQTENLVFLFVMTYWLQWNITINCLFNEIEAKNK